MNKQRERLVELIGSKVCEEYSPSCDEYEPHTCENCYANFCNIGDLADAILADGWMRPPCKVGDKVWTKYGYTFEVEKIEILKDATIYRCGNPGTDDYMAFYESEIGTDVFLTQEEAEEALSKLQASCKQVKGGEE